MAPLPQQTTWQQYIGDGSTTVFIYPFYIPNDADIAVYVTPPNQTPSPQFDIQTLNVDYTVQGSGSLTFAGGTITFIDGAPSGGSLVTVVRDVQNAIDTEFIQARNISGINLDNAFDLLMLCIQQNTNNFQYYGLQYLINSEVPLSSGFSYGNQIPRLQNGYIWMGQNGGIVAVIPELNPDAATLAQQLLMETIGTNGTSIIGYNDPNNDNEPILLKDFLDNMPNQPYVVHAGAIMPFVTITTPNGFLYCDGSSVSRTTYANLFSTVTYIQSCALTETSFDATVVSTEFMYVGTPIEGEGIQSGTIVETIVNNTSIVLSKAATMTGSSNLTFFINGNGDGSTTFNLPDLRRIGLYGDGGTGNLVLGNVLGSRGGSEDAVLTSNTQLAPHNHGGTAAVTVTTITGFENTVLGGGGGTPYLLNPGTVSVEIAGSGTGSATIDSDGSSAPFSVLNPNYVVRFFIKT